MEKIRVGISACLLGENVRYDGGHQLDRFLRDSLGAFFEYVSVCPEVEAGFGVPREPIRLVGAIEDPHILTVNTARDLTGQMQDWAAQRVETLASENLCGFIFKSRSPSSGMERVKVYPVEGGGMPIKKGVGLFARAFMDRFPFLPVEEEGRLHDENLRENFIERVFVMKRWRELDGTRAALVDFHSRHKYVIMAHSPVAYRQLGQLVADLRGDKLERAMQEYVPILMTALKLIATPKKTTNVLMHVMGYFKRQLTAAEKQELVEIIREYCEEQIPLIVPVTMLNHYVRKYEQPYLAEQYFLNPHPLELKLRNHC
jgi:uncharacterized protein YbgA (DUF1722 family)/uncharacterized protein YbbK (DUF523 family)